MVYANLSAGIIKSVSSAKAAQASGLFVASLYIPPLSRATCSAT